MKTQAILRSICFDLEAWGWTSRITSRTCVHGIEKLEAEARTYLSGSNLEEIKNTQKHGQHPCRQNPGVLVKGFLSIPPISCVASVSSPFLSGTTVSPAAYSESPPGTVPISLCAAPLVSLLLMKHSSSSPGTTMGLDTVPELFTRCFFLLLKSYPPFYSSEMHGDLCSFFFLSKTTILIQVSISLIWLVQPVSQSSSQHMLD